MRSQKPRVSVQLVLEVKPISQLIMQLRQEEQKLWVYVAYRVQLPPVLQDEFQYTCLLRESLSHIFNTKQSAYTKRKNSSHCVKGQRPVLKQKQNSNKQQLQSPKTEEIWFSTGESKLEICGLNFLFCLCLEQLKNAYHY